MKALEDKVRAYKPDGLTCMHARTYVAIHTHARAGGDSGLEDLAFGIKILRIAAALMSDQIKADDVVAGKSPLSADWLLTMSVSVQRWRRSRTCSLWRFTRTTRSKPAASRTSLRHQISVLNSLQPSCARGRFLAPCFFALHFWLQTLRLCARLFAVSPFHCTARASSCGLPRIAALIERTMCDVVTFAVGASR